MGRRAVHTTVLLLILNFASCARRPVVDQSPSYYYDDYYYDDYQEPAAAPAPKPSAAAADDDYDLSELVKAWKDYIKEKSNGPSQPRRRLRPVVEYECPPREDDSYRTPDSKQCDKFYECNIKGEEKTELCPDGLMFDIKSERCDYPAKVNCTGRPELQTAQPSKNCPRANGFFPFPAKESCQKFWDCRGGLSYLQVCPNGVIFDSFVDACVTPDQAKRVDCRAEAFLGFKCPKYKEDDVLRFGNHDRLPDPDNCQQFFSCLKTGEPRLGACPKNTVFSFATGHCADPKTVTGCENYWKDKLEDSDDYSYYD